MPPRSRVGLHSTPRPRKSISRPAGVIIDEAVTALDVQALAAELRADGFPVIVLEQGGDVDEWIGGVLALVAEAAIIAAG